MGSLSGVPAFLALLQAALFHTLCLVMPRDYCHYGMKTKAAVQLCVELCPLPSLRFSAVSSDYSRTEDLLNVRDEAARRLPVLLLRSALWHRVLSVYLFSSIIKNTTAGRQQSWLPHTHSRTHSQTQ